MMNGDTLQAQLRSVLAEGMMLPEPIERLLRWIEARGMVRQHDDGRRTGHLYPPEDLDWTDDERCGGTIILFFADDPDYLRYWFGHNDPAVIGRVRVFAKTGSDGSMAAFWLDPQGRQKIVHMGSGSGSTLVCTLADDPVDFLRLLAIGYDEICWPEYYDRPPNANESERFVHPNAPYQEWVRTEFRTTIPATASEIVRHPSLMSDPDPADPFARWTSEHAG